MYTKRLFGYLQGHFEDRGALYGRLQVPEEPPKQVQTGSGA